MRTVKELRSDVPMEMLMRIKRCNLEQMKKLSSGVRKKSLIQRAAVEKPEKRFVEEINTLYPDQHLEVKRPVEMVPEGNLEQHELAIKMAMLVDECATRAEAQLAIDIAYIQTNQRLYDDLVAEHREESAA